MHLGQERVVRHLSLKLLASRPGPLCPLGGRTARGLGHRPTGMAFNNQEFNNQGDEIYRSELAPPLAQLREEALEEVGAFELPPGGFVSRVKEISLS